MQNLTDVHSSMMRLCLFYIILWYTVIEIHILIFGAVINELHLMKLQKKKKKILRIICNTIKNYNTICVMIEKFNNAKILNSQI